MIETPVIAVGSTTQAQAEATPAQLAAASLVHKGLMLFKVATESYGIISLHAMSAFRGEYTVGKEMLSNSQMAGAIVNHVDHCIRVLMLERIEGLCPYAENTDIDLLACIDDLKQELTEASSFSSSFTLLEYVQAGTDKEARSALAAREVQRTVNSLCEAIKQRLRGAPAIPTVDTNTGAELHEVMERHYEPGTKENPEDGQIYESIRTEVQASQEHDQQS